MKTRPALTDVATLRRQARKHIEEGAVTAGYAADRDVVLRLLNEALAIDPLKDPSTQLVTLITQRRARALLDHIESKFAKN